eukprot:13122003-Alexandrium_andersonii.AAC.1
MNDLNNEWQPTDTQASAHNMMVTTCTTGVLGVRVARCPCFTQVGCEHCVCYARQAELVRDLM